VLTVAERVSTHKPLILNGISLSSEHLLPARPAPLYTGDKVSHDSVLFVNLPANIETDYMRQYASKAAGGVTVDRIVFSLRPGIALVQYSAPIGSSVASFLIYYFTHCNNFLVKVNPIDSFRFLNVKLIYFLQSLVLIII